MQCWCDSRQDSHHAEIRHKAQWPAAWDYSWTVSHSLRLFTVTAPTNRRGHRLMTGKYRQGLLVLCCTALICGHQQTVNGVSCACLDSNHLLVGVLTGAALARLLADLAMFGCCAELSGNQVHSTSSSNYTVMECCMLVCCPDYLQLHQQVPIHTITRSQLCTGCNTCNRGYVSLTLCAACCMCCLCTCIIPTVVFNLHLQLLFYLHSKS